MFNKFADMANEVIRNMYQAIFDLNTTAVLIDSKGRVNYIWRNIGALKKYILDIKIDNMIEEKERAGVSLLKAIENNSVTEAIIENSAGADMTLIGIPIHTSKGEILGCLGVFSPLDTGNVGYVRGIVKITADALEGKWKAIELKRDYDSMYQKFLGTMETVPLGTMVTDSDLTIIHINDATLKIFGIEKEEILGQNIDLFFNSGREFCQILESERDLFDEDMSFEVNGSQLKCEVITTHLSSPERGKKEGLVIKLKNSKYHQTYKKSKNHMKAQFNFEDIQGDSDVLHETIRLAKIAAQSMSNVLILGESGTGKELFAQAVHNHSLRREGPFVAVNCGAMSSTLIESELFGYEGGAFTGASKEGKAGKFEQANGGTLFLDEIGEMPLKDQVNLLRVLQNKEIVRLGGSKTIQTNVRIIAATNRDVEQMVREKKFRSDLYYRLNVFSLDIPSLEERQQDIFLLADYFIRQYTVSLNKEVSGISQEVKDVFLIHSWPGNVRELENVIERAINVARADLICLEDLPQNMKRLKGESAAEEPCLNRVQSMERKAIEDALKQCKGNISKTAEFLGLGRRSLYRRLQVYSINSSYYK